MTSSNRLQTYDILIAIAIISMIIDHFGYFFFQDIEALRVIGRLAAPLFLFLAGYGNNHIKPSYLLWGGLLSFGIDDKSLDILITFFVLAISYQYILRPLPNIITLCAVIFISFVAFIVQVLFEIQYLPVYIHVAFPYFMAGKALYNKQLYYSLAYLTFALVFHFAFYFLGWRQPLLLPFIIILLIFLYAYFYYIEWHSLHRITRNAQLRFISSYSLHIYIMHLSLFIVIQHYLIN